MLHLITVKAVSDVLEVLQSSKCLPSTFPSITQTLDSLCFLKGLGHAILGNFV